MATLKDINDRFKAVKQPSGESKLYASRSCRDLFLDHPDKESGDYWIDPNLGCTDDAILVHCDKTTKETCLTAETHRVINATWYTGKSKRIFYSAMRGGGKFTYADKVQLLFLRLLSIHARQTVTFTCRNVEANLEFLSSSNVVLRDYEVIENTCNSGEWGRAVISYETALTDNLPFEDFSVGDLGAEDQEFGLEMGKVCFA